MDKHSPNFLCVLSPKRLFLTFILVLTLTTLFTLFPSRTISAETAATTYYLDCNGSDQNNGTSPSTAWRTLSKANSAPLSPGGSLLLKRGCVWTGSLKAKWNGTADQMITIGAYGSGALPVIQNGSTDLSDKYHSNMDITGSYQIIENIETRIVNPPVDPNCQNNPIGYYVGFNLINPNNLPNGGSYNLLRYDKASGHTIGAFLATNTHNNQIAKSTFTDNHVMQVLTPTSVAAHDDLGAWGIVLHGSYQEISFNYFSNNQAWCAYDTTPQGNSIELYEARYNKIHHNTSINDGDFSELGGSANIKSDNNSFVYNLVVSSVLNAHFITVRGGGIDKTDGNAFGPTYRTYVYNNTVYYTNPQSQGIICGGGCSSDILIAKNNIIWAEWKAMFADAPFTESNNIYWNSSGTPLVQFQNFSMNSTSRKVNPQFVDPANLDFHLKSTSPAINKGMKFWWMKDINCVSLPQSSAYDVGSAEFIGTPTLEVAEPEVSYSTFSNLNFLPFLLSSISADDSSNLPDPDIPEPNVTAYCP